MTTLAVAPFDLNTSLPRFEAWWNASMLDRPPLRFQLPSSLPPPPLSWPVPKTPLEEWTHPPYAAGAGLAGLESREWLADSVPVYMPNLGPDVTGTLFGCHLQFGQGTTWCNHPIVSEEDYDSLATAEPDFTNPFWKAVENLTRWAFTHRQRHDHFIGLTDLHGAVDTLVSLRGPEALCLDLLDCPELVHAALRNLSNGIARIYERNEAILLEHGQEVRTTWTPFLHKAPAYVTSCDFLALVSRQMAEEFVRPYLRAEWRSLDRSLFHLDGPDALHHLEWLLEEDWIQGIQWVYGAGHGGARDWIDVYRKIRQAGRCVHLYATSPADAIAVVEAIGPEGVWIDVAGQHFANAEEAGEFVRKIERMCGQP